MKTFKMPVWFSEEKADRDMWNGTRYQGMKFVRESPWDNFDRKYACPVFSFENGDRVVYDRRGEIVVL